MDNLTVDVFQTPAIGILNELEADGFSVSLTDDGLLNIAPRSRLSPDRMTAITAWKDSIRLLVRCCDAGVADRRDHFRRHVDRHGVGGLPALLYRPDIPYQPGVCFSCGDGLTTPTYGRCWRCALAWRLACRLPVPIALAEAVDAAKMVA